MVSGKEDVMNSQRVNGRGRLLIVAGMFALFWNLFGIVLNRENGRGRFFFGPDRVVTRVTEGGPGEAAGIQVGDRVVSVDGTPADELPMQSRWSQRRVGESRIFELDRDGQMVSAEVVYGPVRGDPVADGIRGLIVSIAFVGIGLWTLFTVRTSLAWVVALIGITFASGAASGPHLGSWQGLTDHIQITCALLCAIFILKFFVTFPRPKKVSGSRWASRTVLGAFLSFVALLVVELIVHPVLYNVYGIVLVFLLLPLLLLSLVAVGHSAVTCTADERRETGLNLVLLGLVVGIVIPITAPLLAGAFSFAPDFFRNWMWVLELTFPASLALAVRKRAQLGDVALD
jgi:hypothetical protein